MATLTGKTLGNYQIFERIGRGGMADVYKGRHTRLEREVAVKVLHAYLADGEDFLARFEREARAIASLHHPRIVQVYDFDVEDETAYMVMEFIAGGNLRLRLEDAFKKRSYLPLDVVGRILTQVGEGLDYAHLQGMLHRDIKPANVLLREDGEVVLADFGIARILSTTQFTATGSLIGTPAYMSPEQGRGDPLTPASDLYSLGVILYEMLANRVPFDSETPLAIIHQQIHDPLPALTRFRDDLPSALIEVVEKSLAKEPDGRFRSARELGEAFQAGSGGGNGGDLRSTVVMVDTARTDMPGESLPMEAAEPLGPTVVMEEEAPEPSESHVPREELIALAPPLEGAPAMEERAARRGPNLRRLWPVALLLVLAAAFFGVGSMSGWFSPNALECDDLGQCAGLAEDAMRAGDFADAVVLFDQALDRVPAEEQPPFAELWCRRADAMLALERVDEAVRSLEMCAAWTRDTPELQGMRDEVSRRIEELLGGGIVPPEP